MSERQKQQEIDDQYIPVLVTVQSTSHNVGSSLGRIRYCPLLNSTFLVFRFELT